MSKDSDFLESLRITPGDLIQCDGQELRKAKSFKRPWCKFDYERQLELARMARDPLIAVQAELYYLWYKLPKNDKSRPIELGSKVFKKWGLILTINLEPSNIWKTRDSLRLNGAKIKLP
jgi:hypothetical protein